MKKLTNKIKGFTLTELAIVIAVIAILIAVLVPTFISLINSANESKDTQTIYNVNNALAIESATTTIETPAQALDVAEKAGYNIENLTPTSESEIYYDQENVRFIIVYSDGTRYPTTAENTELNSPTIWRFVDESTYSTIVSQASTATVQTAKTAIKTDGEVATAKTQAVSYIAKGEWSGSFDYTGMGGIDTSRASGITEINYTYEQTTGVSAVDILINTDILSVNVTTSVSITISSYTSENTLTKIQSSNEIVVTINDNYGAVYQGDLNVITVNSDKDYVLKDSDFDIDISNGAIELGTEKYPYLIKEADHLSKLANGGYGKLIESITSASVTITSGTEVTLDLNGFTFTSSSTAISVESGATLVLNGNGGTVTATNTNYYSIDTEGTVYVNGANLTAPSYYDIYVQGGETIINEDSVIKSLYGIYISSGTLSVNDGTISGSNSSGYGIIAQGGTVNIYGGEITGKYGVRITSGNLNISGGEITGTSYGVHHTVAINVSGGTITGPYGIYGNANATVSGGTITGTSNFGVYNSQATLNVLDGTISGKKGGIWSSGILSISGGDISCTAVYSSTTDTYGVYICPQKSTSKATISGGEIYNAYYGVYVYYSSYSGALTVSGSADITGYVYGVYNFKQTLNVTGGTITGGTKTDGIYTNGDVDTPDAIYSNRGTVNISGGTITSTTGNSYGILGGDVALTISGGEINGNYGGVFIGTYETSGYGTGKVTMTKGSVNGTKHGLGAAYIVIEGGTITSDYLAAYAYYSATISGGEIKATGSGSYGFYLFDGTGTISGGTISGVGTGIYNAGTLTITNGTISSNGNGIYNGYYSSIPTLPATVSGTRTISLTISGGTITGASYSVYEYDGALAISGGTFNGNIGSLTQSNFITGGTFSSNVSSFVADGYKVSDEANGYYEVTAE